MSSYQNEAINAYRGGVNDFYRWIKSRIYLFPSGSWASEFPRASHHKFRPTKVIENVGFSESGKTTLCNNLSARFPNRVEVFPEFLGFPYTKLDTIPDDHIPSLPESSILPILTNMSLKLSSFMYAYSHQDPDKRTIVERGPFDAVIDFFHMIMILEQGNRLISYIEPLAIGFLNCLPLLAQIDGLLIIEVTDYGLIRERRRRQGKADGVYSGESYFMQRKTAMACALAVMWANNPGVGLIVLDGSQPEVNNTRRASRYLDK